MQEPAALGRVVALVRDLRKRCPWDAAQTPQSLRPYLVEEALELDHALGDDDPERIKKELGDVLLHVAFQIVLAEERGAFGAEDLTRAVEAKMWRRHPHLFADAPTPAGPEQQRQTWERVKSAERQATGRGVLEGLPPNLPALIMAMRLQERAAGVGFDWPDAKGPLEKVREETGEIEAEVGRGAAAERVADEIGDLLFAVVNLARKLGCDPRAALQKANARFLERFRRMETLAQERGVDIGRASLAELDRLWDAAKVMA